MTIKPRPIDERAFRLAVECGTTSIPKLAEMFHIAPATIMATARRLDLEVTLREHHDDPFETHA